MNCVFPPELEDRQILAYLDGEADNQVVSHLASARIVLTMPSSWPACRTS